MGEIREIQSIPVVSFALILGAIFAVMIFIWTLIFAILELSLAFLPLQNMGISVGSNLVGSIILIAIGTITAFIVGFIVSAVIAIFYNILAPKIGGIELELK